MEHLPARRRPLLAALAVAALAGAAALPAAAKPAYMDASIRAQVGVGMTQDEVTRMLGRPMKTRKYRDGSTWGYQIGPETWFLVDFGTDGKVKEATQKFIAAW